MTLQPNGGGGGVATLGVGVQPVHKWPLRPGVQVHVNGSNSLTLQTSGSVLLQSTPTRTPTPTQAPLPPPSSQQQPTPQPPASASSGPHYESISEAVVCDSGSESTRSVVRVGLGGPVRSTRAPPTGRHHNQQKKSHHQHQHNNNNNTSNTNANHSQRRHPRGKRHSTHKDTHTRTVWNDRLLEHGVPAAVASAYVLLLSLFLVDDDDDDDVFSRHATLSSIGRCAERLHVVVFLCGIFLFVSGRCLRRRCLRFSSISLFFFPVVVVVVVVGSSAMAAAASAAAAAAAAAPNDAAPDISKSFYENLPFHGLQNPPNKVRPRIAVAYFWFDFSLK